MTADYRLLQTEDEFEQFVSQVLKYGHFAVDTETTGRNSLTCELVGICVSAKPETGFYIPIAHNDGPNVDLELVRYYLSGLLADERQVWFDFPDYFKTPDTPFGPGEYDVSFSWSIVRKGLVGLEETWMTFGWLVDLGGRLL